MSLFTLTLRLIILLLIDILMPLDAMMMLPMFIRRRRCRLTLYLMPRRRYAYMPRITISPPPCYAADTVMRH